MIIRYSSDGLLSEKEIAEILIKNGISETYNLHKIPYRKYKSKHKQNSDELYEYLFYIQKNIKTKNKRKKKVHEISNDSYKVKYVKSPLNYIGGKYKLLKQIVPLFPNRINRFVDLFCGGFNVGANVNAKKIYANDINDYVVDILEKFKLNDIDRTINHIEKRIAEFGLSKYNENGFKKFREFYNYNENKNPLDLYTLICYSFNYQFRFNNSHKYNNPFGRNRSQFSDELKSKLLIFIENLRNKKIEFSSLEFENFNFDKLERHDLVYCDPPYLITTGSYNDGNRGFKDWNEE